MIRSPQLAQDTSGMPRFQQYQYEFTAHLRSPAHHRPPRGVSAKRIGVYVDLLRNKIEDSLLSCFPVTRKLLGKRSWNRLVKHFIATHACVSPLYRQIPEEFIAFLNDKRTAPSDPPFLAELAHFEWVELAIAIAKAAPVESGVESPGSLFDATVVVTPTLQLLRYNYPVQLIAPHHDGWRSWKAWRNRTPESMRNETFILSFRDPENEVRFIEINPATARLIELLATQPLSGRQALLQLASELKAPEPDAIIAFGVDILGTLETQGAILGSRPGP